MKDFIGMKKESPAAVILFIVLLVLLMTISVPLRAEGIVQVALKDHVTMKNQQLKIKDIVDSNETDVDFVRRYGDITVTDDTADLDNISRSKLYSLLHDSGANLDNLRVQMKSSVSIERGQQIELTKNAHNKILDTVALTYNIPKTDITILRARIMPRIDAKFLPSLYFKSVEPQDMSQIDNAKLKVMVENDDGVESEHTLYLKMGIETAVLVLKEDLEPGVTLASEHFIPGRNEIKTLSGKVVRPGDLKNQTFKITKSVKRDQILVGDMIRKSVMIGSGALVTLSYKTPHLNISTMGKIQGEGEIGQVVKVENIDSNRVVTGKLVSADLVEVIHD